MARAWAVSSAVGLGAGGVAGERSRVLVGACSGCSSEAVQPSLMTPTDTLAAGGVFDDESVDAVADHATPAGNAWVLVRRPAPACRLRRLAEGLVAAGAVSASGERPAGECGRRCVVRVVASSLRQ